MRGKNLFLSLQDVVQRAVSMRNTGVYKLGEGGKDPEAASPYTNGKADCIGFALWCQGFDRLQKEHFLPDLSRWSKKNNGRLPDADAENPHGAIYGGWMNTNSLLQPNTLFLPVPWQQVLPGDLLLYPSYSLTEDDDSPTKIGHAQLVVRTDGYDVTDVEFGVSRWERKSRWPEECIRNLVVIHCNARSKPATVQAPAKVPLQVANKWGFVRPAHRYEVT